LAPEWARRSNEHRLFSLEQRKPWQPNPWQPGENVLTASRSLPQKNKTFHVNDRQRIFYLIRKVCAICAAVYMP
jgi:hypothetical protein